MLILQGVTGNWPRSVSQTSIGLPGWHEQKNGSYHAGDHQKKPNLSVKKAHPKSDPAQRPGRSFSELSRKTSIFSTFSHMNLAAEFSGDHIQVQPPNETAAFDDMVSSDWNRRFLGFRKRVNSSVFQLQPARALLHFLESAPAFPVVSFFKWKKTTNSQLFPNTSGHIPVYNPYNYILYVCIITSSSYMLVIHLLFQGLPHSYQPVRPDKFS